MNNALVGRLGSGGAAGRNTIIARRRDNIRPRPKGNFGCVGKTQSGESIVVHAEVMPNGRRHIQARPSFESVLGLSRPAEHEVEVVLMVRTNILPLGVAFLFEK